MKKKFDEIWSFTAGLSFLQVCEINDARLRFSVAHILMTFSEVFSDTFFLLKFIEIFVDTIFFK